MVRTLAILLVSLLIIPFRVAYAQDEGDDFFDDEPDLEQPLDVEEPQSNPQIPRPSDNRPSISRFNRPSNSNDDTSSDSSGEIVFRLVDPPKFWKPKKRKHHFPMSYPRVSEKEK